MGVFVVLLLVPMMMQHLVVRRSYINYDKKNKGALAFFFICLTLIVALRHESIGNDTKIYTMYFANYSSIDWMDLWHASSEIGYAYLNKAVSLISTDPQILLFVVAVIFSIMIYPTYSRLCEDASLTMVLFSILPIFVMMFSGLRQVLAMGIGFVAYELTRRKKILWFVLTVGIATLFHISAFILMFMYPLYYVRITKKWLYAVIPAFAVILVFNEQIFVSLSNFLKRFTDFDTQITRTGAYTMLILFIAFAIISFLFPDEKKLNEETIGLRNFLLFSVFLQMFAPLHTLAMRLNYYYIIFIPLLIPKVIKYRGEKWKHIAIIARHVMVIFFFFYFFISIRNEANLNVFPYHFFWEQI